MKSWVLITSTTKTKERKKKSNRGKIRQQIWGGGAESNRKGVNSVILKEPGGKYQSSKHFGRLFSMDLSLNDKSARTEKTKANV
jgi:hypothetical protein